MELSTIFFFFLFTFLIHNSSCAMASIEEVCKAAAASSPNVDYKFCVTSLQAIPGSRTADAKGVAVLAAKLSMANATVTKMKIPVLVRKAADPRTKECLKTCLEVYGDLVADLKISIDGLLSGRLGDAQTYLSAALDEPDTCESSFREAKLNSLLYKEDKDSTGLTAIALAITASL